MRVHVFAAVAVISFLAANHSIAGDDPTALVLRAIDATGGADKLKAARRSFVRAEGTLFKNGTSANFSVQLWRDPPGRSRTETTMSTPVGELTETAVIADGKGWRAQGGKPAVSLEGTSLDAGQTGLHVSWVTDLVDVTTDREFTLTSLGADEIGGRKADGVKAARKGKPDVNLWFDRETGLLVKYTARYPAGVQDIYIGEYKEFGGVKRPTRRIGYHDGVKACEDRITEYKVLDKIDGTLFRSPAPNEDAREIVRKHLTAVGGIDRLKKTPCEYTRQSIRVFTAGGPVDAEIEFWADYPNSIRQVLTQDAPGGGKTTWTQVYSNGNGWFRQDRGAIRALTKDEIWTWAITASESWAAEIYHPKLEDSNVKFAPLGRATVGGRAALGVEVTRSGQADSKLWFDAESHLLVKREERASGGRVREVLLSDYTESDGIKRPTKIIFMVGNQKATETTIKEHRHSEKLTESLLDRPKE